MQYTDNDIAYWRYLPWRRGSSKRLEYGPDLHIRPGRSESTGPVFHCSNAGEVLTVRVIGHHLPRSWPISDHDSVHRYPCSSHVRLPRPCVAHLRRWSEIYHSAAVHSEAVHGHWSATDESSIRHSIRLKICKPASSTEPGQWTITQLMDKRLCLEWFWQTPRRRLILFALLSLTKIT